MKTPAKDVNFHKKANWHKYDYFSTRLLTFKQEKENAVTLEGASTFINLNG